MNWWRLFRIKSFVIFHHYTSHMGVYSWKDGDDTYQVIYEINTTVTWYKNGEVHREDKPAKYRLGSDEQYWYMNGKRHRKDGPAVIEFEFEIWYQDGKKHRDDGPAAIHINGQNEWYVNGKIHRLDGPAIVRNDGLYQWWVNGKHVSQKMYDWAKDRDIDLMNLTDEDKMIIQLEWGNYEK